LLFFLYWFWIYALATNASKTCVAVCEGVFLLGKKYIPSLYLGVQFQLNKITFESGGINQLEERGDV